MALRTDISKLAELRAKRLEFPLEKPPTQEAIESRRQQLKDYLEQPYRMESDQMHVAFGFGLAFMAIWFLGASETLPASLYGLLLLGFFSTLGLYFLWRRQVNRRQLAELNALGFESIWAAELAEYNLLAEVRYLEEIPQADCESLLAACEATPEGLAYRAAVVAMARRFVKVEDQVIKQWAETVSEREACKKLYEVPV